MRIPFLLEVECRNQAMHFARRVDWMFAGGSHAELDSASAKCASIRTRAFFLNGEPIRLNGVAIHQNFLGCAWAVTEEEMELSLGLIQEVGARAIRLGHYPVPEHMLQRVNELGFVVWSEMPSGLRTTAERCSTTDPTPEFMENARQQLQEMIRQQYNALDADAKAEPAELLDAAERLVPETLDLSSSCKWFCAW